MTHIGAKPKLSIVVTARNDNHGGGFLRRMQIFINGLLNQAERHKLKAELIVVEWNPPTDRPPLFEVLKWPEKNEFCTVRFFEVPPGIHNRYKYATKLPLYQMIAKNVGIRYARAEFLLATNIDLLFSDELVKFLASDELVENYVYRVDRYDIPEDIPLNAPIDEQLQFCQENVIRINSREGTHNLLTGRYFPTYAGLNTDSTRLHFNACGDFTLMSVKDWHFLNGYPEFDMYSAHIDSLLLLMAYHAGIGQVILPDQMRTYHIEHSSCMIAEIAAKLSKDLKAANIPEIKISQLEEWASEMNRNQRPIIFNDSEWGFASERLKETIVISASWEAKIKSEDPINKTPRHVFKEVSPATEKSILIIAEHLPLYDINPEDNNFYQMIKVLAKYHRVVFLARSGVEKGKYIENLRKKGVIVFYDVKGLKKQILRDPKSISRYASSVVVETVFTHHKFDVVLLESPEIAGFYLNTIRELSPQSVIMISAFTAENNKVYAYEQADVVISDPGKAEFLLSMLPDLNIRVLPKSPSDNFFEKGLLKALNNLPEPIDKNLGRFRLYPDSIPVESLNKTELTVVFVVKDVPEIAKFSMGTLFNNTGQNHAKIIVAIDSKADHGIGNKLERGFKHYFIYENEQELTAFICRVIKHCQSNYVTIMDSSVIVPPHWDRRLVAHFKQDPQIGIVTPAVAELSYNSVYEFEKDAWSVYDKNKGLNVFSNRVDVSCIIIDCSTVGENKYHNLTGLISEIVNKGSKIAIAKDTLVRHLNPGLKKKTNKIRFENPEAKLLSVVIPSYNNKEELLKCLGSLFNQKDADYKKLEIIVVDDGSEDGTIEALDKIKAPCKFRYYSRSHKGWSAAINRGIVEAAGSFILLTSPYVIADENLISEHLKTHEKYSGEDIAVLGRISASPPEGIGEITPFMKFLLKSPLIQYGYEFAFDYNDIESSENVEYEYFYTPNLSLKRDIFQDVGLFEEGLQHGVQDLEFGFRVSLNKYRIVYNRDAVADLYRRINLEGFLERQISVGRQQAILSQIHPGIFDVNPIKMSCVRHLLGKERLVERAEELVDELEKMPEGIRNNYKFSGSSLLERCYIILSDYYYAMGINEALKEHEGDNWLDTYIDGMDVELQHLKSKNQAYELLMESYYRAGKGDFPAFLDGVEQAAQLIPMHASPYYALGSFYLNLEKHKPAEETFGKGLEKRKSYNSLSILPVEDEALYYMWLAMACIPQGKYKKAAEVLEELIAERLPVSVEQGSFVYKCLSLSYKALDEERKAIFCKEESDRLKEELKTAV